MSTRSRVWGVRTTLGCDMYLDHQLFRAKLPPVVDHLRSETYLQRMPKLSYLPEKAVPLQLGHGVRPKPNYTSIELRCKFECSRRHREVDVLE